MKRIKSFEHSSICYFVATPIGNLNDISKRALDVLKSVDVIACEDTRTTLSLLNHFSINKQLISYHEHNEQLCSQKLISLLKENKSIAVVSDAGYPGISDPGSILVTHCIENDIPVSIIPGANAFLPALIGSGMDTTHFYFNGFLSSKPSLRKKELGKLTNFDCTLIFYESPHRIKETLLDMYEILSNRKACIVREITKIHEEYIYGTLKELSNIDETTLKGEMVIIVEKNNQEQTIDDDQLLILLNNEINNGNSLKDASKKVSEETGIKKNYLYQLGLKQ